MTSGSRQPPTHHSGSFLTYISVLGVLPLRSQVCEAAHEESSEHCYSLHQRIIAEKAKEPLDIERLLRYKPIPHVSVLLLLVVVRPLGEVFSFSLGYLLLIALVVEMRHSDPCMRHLIRRTAAAPHPLIRIGVLPVRGRVVVVARNHQDVTRWHERCGVICIDVTGVPVVGPVRYRTYHLQVARRRIEDLEGLAHQTEVTVRLEAVDPHRGLEGMEPLGHRRAVRGKLELGTLHQQGVKLEVLFVLRLLLMAFRVEPDAHLDHIILDALTVRIVVDVPSDHRVSREKTTGVLRHNLAGLAQCVFGEPLNLDPLLGLLVIVEQLGVGVVRDAAPRCRCPDGNRLQASILGQAARHDRPPPDVRPFGRNGVRLRRDHQVRRAVVSLVGPLVEIRKGQRRREIGRVAKGRAFVHPAGDRRDFQLGQPEVVFEVLNADVAVVPIGRHLAQHHAILDRPGPGAHFLIIHERHRSYRVRPVARLAALLKNRCDVLGKCRRNVSVLRNR